MRIIAITLATVLCACGNLSSRRSLETAAITHNEPTHYTYRIVASYPHATDAYTQGLTFHNGILWEGTGEYGRSQIRTLNLQNGSYHTEIKLPPSEFGEGIAIHGGNLYQLTWESNTCHMYSIESGLKIRDFRYQGEGWGLTTDGKKLYMSNGSANIYRINPENFRREGSITVTYLGEPVQFINELEWIDGKIWANVYTTDKILIINPKTGIVEGDVDLTGILPADERTAWTDVLNGIAYDEANKRILVTGKRWPKLYEIELIKQ